MSSTSLIHFQPNTPTTSLSTIFLTLSNSNYSITMNSFAVVFAALIITVSGSSLRAGRQGWGAPPPPSVDIELSASGAAAGAGAADSTIDVLAVAVGGPDVPAEVGLNAYSNAIVQQDIDVLQVASIDLANGPTSSSLNNIVVDNVAAASEGVNAVVIGQESAYLAESGADSASGVGQISASASSLNTQIGG